MINATKHLASTLGFLALSASLASADGIDPIYAGDGGFIDDIEIIGDVTFHTGETYAVLEMRAQQMRFYVDPDAIYVLMDPNNPIITNQTRFPGFWVSTARGTSPNWPTCTRPFFDENGALYQNYGDVFWTNIGFSPDGNELAFVIDVGTCDDVAYEWGLSDAVFEIDASAGAGPHGGDLTGIGAGGGTVTGGGTNTGSSGGDRSKGGPQTINTTNNNNNNFNNTYTLTDSNNTTFTVHITPDGTSLDSDSGTPTFITLGNKTSPPIYEAVSLAIYADCSAFSQQHGWGNWSWANGGFVIDYPGASFSFPRMDPPMDNGGGCRM